MRAFLDKEAAEKNTLLLNLHEATDNNKTLYDRMQELESESKQWEEEKAALNSQLQQAQRSNE